jgi:formamidase
MQDRVAGRYRRPWEDRVKVTDGTPSGFERPTRRYGEKFPKAAE